MSGFAALAAAVEAVVPLPSGSTALTTTVVLLWVQDLAPLMCMAVSLGGTVVPPTQAVVWLFAGLLGGVMVGFPPPTI